MEGVSNRKFLVNALKNNSFSLLDVEHTIDDIINKSFNHLYEYQYNKVGLHRFNFTSDDILIENNKMELVVSKDLIEQYARKTYRLSDLFGKELTLQDIESDRKSFIKIPIVFMDGRPIFDYKVGVYKDKTLIIFKYDKTLLSNHNFTVIYVYNSGFTTGSLNKFIVEKYRGNVPTDKFFDVSKLSGDYDGKLVSSVLSDSGTNTSFFSLGNSLARSNSYVIPYTANEIVNNQKTFTSVIFSIPFLNDIDRVYKVRTNSSGEEKIELCVIQNSDGRVYNNPIPVENILVFKKEKDTDEFILDNNCSVKLHYPNIYEIIDTNQESDSEYMVKYFYVPLNDNISYRDKMDVFYYLMRKDASDTMSFEDVINDIYFSDKSQYKYHELFDAYFNYTDYVYKYTIGDFRQTDYPNHFNYKVDKMWDFIHAYPEHLREYIRNQHKIGVLYWLDVRDIDLSSRIRNNTKEEAPNKPVETFEEDCYVFSFRNEGTSYLNLRFFIDGNLYSPKYNTLANGMQYIYIPTTVINEDSFLEIEKFEDFVFTDSMELVYNDLGKEFEIYVNEASENFIPTVSDIFFIDKKTGEYLDRDKFKISIKIDDMYAEVDGNSYTHVGKILIELKDATYSHVPMYVKISKRASFISYDIKTNALFAKRMITTDFNRSREYIRVFLNGRLLPEQLWYITGDNILNPPYLNIKYVLSKGDVVSVDLTPFKYTKVFSKPKVDADGIIDLEGFINKPFDLMVYDAYINGRKLTEKNIKYLTPTKIKLVGTKSLSNFIIYEKDRDDEYFYLDYNKSVQSKMIEDVLLDDKDNLTSDDKDDVIRYIIGGDYPDNTDDEEVINADESVSEYDLDLLAFYNDELSNVKHLNPDVYQFLKLDISQYSSVYDQMVSDGRTSGSNVLVLNPDINTSADIVLRVGSPQL